MGHIRRSRFLEKPVVVTVYPGSSARDVEELVTTPVEDAIKNLDGVKKISSTSQLGISNITIEYNADQNQTEAVRKLREAVDGITTLPTEVERPTVIEVNFNDQPIITLGLSGISDTRILSLYAKQIADQIEAIPQVSHADISGERTEQIGIRVEPQILKSYGISVGQIAQAIRANNINAPFGSITTGSYGYELRLVGKYQSIGDVANIPIRVQSGAVVPLSQVATVTQELSDSSSLSRISVNGKESTESVSISVRKKAGGNIIQIVDEVHKRVAQMQKDKILPNDLEVSSFADNADDIRKSLRNVGEAGLETLLIVFCVLWLYLGWREALLASLAVPFTLSMSFIFFGWNGTTLNSLSLFALILALGLLVDDAIVIIDGIYSRKSDLPLAEHASYIVSEFFKPLTAGTLTTVSAFFPMLLVSGIIGQFLKTIPIVLTATLLSSLFVAIALLPAVAVKLFGKPRKTTKERWFTIQFLRLSTWYTKTIDAALQNRSFQNKFIGALAILMVVGLALPFTGLLKTGLFPAADIDYVVGNVELAPGATKDATERVMQEVEMIVRSQAEVDSAVFNVGSSTSTGFGSGSSGESLGSFSVNLQKNRTHSSAEISDILRKKLQQISDGKVTIAEVSSGPPTSAPIEMHISGADLATLDTQSTAIMNIILGISGTTNVDRDLKNSAGQFNLSLNRDALASYGLTASDIAQTMRTVVYGIEATNFLDSNGDKISVRLSATKDTKNSIDELLRLPITTPAGATITLQQVLSPTLATSVDIIRHLDEARTVTITSDVVQGSNSNQITQEIQKKVAAMNIPAGYVVTYGGEQQQTQETFTQLYASMGIAIILIMMIMVVEFNSYRQPFIMFLSIPLALIGVLFGLVLLRGELNFAAFIGLVSLTGIVVKNAILLVDRMNSAREEGKSIRDAVRDSASSRLRPILLTTTTTGLGIIPLVWVDAFFRDLALTILTGLVFSTVLTLGLIPILYYRQAMKIEKKKARGTVVDSPIV
jgi:multidrug efflux pump subunit AcrB